MNKSQIILAAIGGVVVTGALVLGYLIWDGSTVRSEKVEDLDGNIASAAGIVRRLPMKPDSKDFKIFADNCEAYANWRSDAEKVAASGDLVFEKTTPAVFKQAIVEDARKLSDMPGRFNGKLVKPDFHFGFKDYVTGGALPPATDLKRLQREWNDVSSVLKTIAECGGADVGIVDVRMGAAKAQVEEESPQPRKKGKKAKKPVQGENQSQRDVTAEGKAVTAFTVEFMIRPSGFVKAINALATGSRFIVVENFAFTRERDALAEALGGDAKKAAEQSGSSRRRRRAQAQPVEQKEEVKGGLVTDPATAPLLKVTMALSAYDFGSLEEGETK